MAKIILSQEDYDELVQAFQVIQRLLKQMGKTDITMNDVGNMQQVRVDVMPWLDKAKEVHDG